MIEADDVQKKYDNIKEHTMLAASSTNFFPFFTPFGFAMPAGIMPFSAGMSSSFSV